jgi:hypothetical protein
MNRFTIASMPAVLFSATLLVLPSCSSNNPQAKTEHAKTASYQPGVPGGISVETSTLTAYVVSVFDTSREVVLDLPGGKREAVTCGPEVVNFDQIHPGDRVKATVTREVAIAMGTESDPPDTAGDSTVALAPKGAQPGAVMANVKQVTATVTAIDLGRHTATLEFPDGQTRTIDVRHDIDLSKRKVGEKVVIRKTDALALRVEKVDKKG